MKKDIIGYLKATGKFLLGVVVFLWLILAFVTSISCGGAFPWYVTIIILAPLPLIMIYFIKKQNDKAIVNE